MLPFCGKISFSDPISEDEFDIIFGSFDGYGIEIIAFRLEIKKC